jgi:hypothetical protein
MSCCSLLSLQVLSFAAHQVPAGVSRQQCRTHYKANLTVQSCHCGFLSCSSYAICVPSTCMYTRQCAAVQTEPLFPGVLIYERGRTPPWNLVPEPVPDG